MANGEDEGRCVFPLTSLQIGDLQCYLSHVSLYVCSESRKLYMLVDNRPWLEDLVSPSTHLWQLMVTKSRLSPFANSRGKERSQMISDSSSSSNSRISWCSFINAVRLRALLPLNKLRNSLIANSNLNRVLNGFIVFEVAWRDVRGINYFNELQTDTSFAIEAKFMRRWEFDNIAQAAKCISSWFSGTLNDQILLKDHLDHATFGKVFYDSEERFSRTTEDEIIATESRLLHTPGPPDGLFKRRKVMRSICFDDREEDSEILSDPSDCEEAFEATLYRDVLILFRFNDRDLPYKFKDIIMSDLRLLTLLEAGLPSWVLFLQSYPGFCHLYRPWMCPLARALYALISIVTVLIGFYDLYKNVPLLKATASGLFGPLFDWIETWEMISRIKYLGTMLFLHNSQKAIKWFLMATRTLRSFLCFLTQPIAGPFVVLLEVFLPVWNIIIQLAETTFTLTWMVVESSFTMVGNLVEILLLPLWILRSVATSFIYPIVWMLREILYTPFRLVLSFSSLVGFICKFIYDLVGDIWLFGSDIFQLTRNVESTVMSSCEVSMWRTLWNDLFSQVFRALRSILNGFVAFFTACNRHRLSIYNHTKELNQRISIAARRRCSTENIQILQTQTTPNESHHDHMESRKTK
ncbi:hypothetical protein ACJIZ3_000704 [Penstemon smallii]|uniref:Uncharacterized protein n=1 Tax=Penstemon smallii TaxID=265156 RepID=A0ABD3RG44_9LAMI